jgi:hypothetical protein
MLIVEVGQLIGPRVRGRGWIDRFNGARSVAAHPEQIDFHADGKP